MSYLLLLSDIQSELHQKKRRFTDFIFQRVDKADDAAGGVVRGGLERDVRSPRAVSGFATTSSSSLTSASKSTPPQGGIGAGGAPRVRVTSPGAEFRERASRRPAAGGSGSGRNALRTSSSRLSLRSQSRSRGASPLRRQGSSNQLSSSSTTPGSGVSNLRRFHLSKPTAAAAGGFVGKASGGIQKRRGDGVSTPTRAILVEKLARKPGVGKESVLGGVSLKNGEGKDVDSDVLMLGDGGDQTASPAPARKRPVINSAEKRWKAEQDAASSRAKANLTEENEKNEKTGKSVRDDPSNWDHDSDQLAQELQQVALEMMMEETKPSAPKKETSEPTPMAGLAHPKPQLKYQPRNPGRRVQNTAQKLQDPDKMEMDDPVSGYTTGKEDDDSDGDYVYDTYIRRPLPAQIPSSDRDSAAAAAASAETILQASKMPIPIDGDQLSRNIGIVVISAEDEEYWDTYAVSEDSGEEKGWDSEDEDSNAEDHPSTDYPDEDLASGDEEDDPTAIYRNFRHRAASDDEQDFDEYGDDDDFGYHADGVDSDGEISGGRGMSMGWGFR